MPGYDGTGPQGQGPMTGNGGGYCIVEIPDDPLVPPHGFAGVCGAPARATPDLTVPLADSLSLQMTRMQSALLDIERVLEDLESVVGRASGPGRAGDAAGGAA